MKLTDAQRTFLNKLRKSGVTNMLGAAPYLQREFSIEPKEAGSVLAQWMQEAEARDVAQELIP